MNTCIQFVFCCKKMCLPIRLLDFNCTKKRHDDNIGMCAHAVSLIFMQINIKELSVSQAGVAAL